MADKKDVKEKENPKEKPKEEKPEEKAEKKSEKKEEPKKEEKAKEEPKKEEKPKEEKKETKKKKKRTRKTRKKSKSPKDKVVVERGKRKESQARARIREGKGGLRINSKSLNAFSNSYIREIIKEPLRYMGPEANEIDIEVTVRGGGIMGQAQAARTAIAKALVAYFDKMDLKEKFTSIDRSLLVEDTRRVEAKKYGGPKARAKYQKSYR